MISTIVTSVLLASANTAGVIAFSIPQTPSTPTTTTTTTRTAFTRSTTVSPINGIDDHVTGKLYKTSHSRLPMSSSTSSSSSDKELDTSAVIKYLTSAGVEITALAGFLYALDYGITTLDLSVPTWGIAALFYVLSLRSRVFNPLNNQRPDLSKMTKSDGTADGGARGFGDRIMPSWTPPGVFFPILWILINAPLRAYSTALVYGANGHVLCDATILCFAWHLTCGDVWNTINNTERRIGASVAGVFCVWCSVVYATSRYWVVDDLAGKLLGLTALWITVAGALVTDTWRLNPGEDGELDPLYPVKGDAETKFLFEK